MPIPPPKRFPIGTLHPATPSVYDLPLLKGQLASLGLDCNQITDANLNKYLGDVLAQVPRGAVQSFGIRAPGTSPALAGTALRAPAVTDISSMEAVVPPLYSVATGNWEPSATAQGFITHLTVIAYKEHFNWLYDNRATKQFTGTKNDPEVKSDYYDNAEAIKKLFVDVCTDASKSVVTGLDHDTMAAVLSTIIQPMTDTELKDYKSKDSRVIYLVDGYNPSTQWADGVGVLYIQWDLTIKDYQKSSRDPVKHDTRLETHAGSVLYDDTDSLCRDYEAVIKHKPFKITNPSNCPP